jgi:tRNA-splicing ligase RtcB
MLEIQGALGKAIVYADQVDSASMQQLYEMMNHPAFADIPVRVMPDVHAGSGAVIGFTAKLTDKLIPSVVGVDLSCGVRVDEITGGAAGNSFFQKLDDIIRTRVPSGMKVREKVSDFLKDSHHEAGKRYKNILPFLEEVCERTQQDLGRVTKSLGTLGGGNHFISLDRSEDGKHFLTIHSGSRNFGLRIANFHQQKAVDANHKRSGFSKALCWLEGEQAQRYLDDTKVAHEFAQLSRYVMYLEIADEMGWDTEGVEHIECTHNYIDLEHGYIRKGAISAQEGERVVIPISMAEGVILGTGKGNPDWNYSAPHGAGRLLSRSKAKETLSLDEYRKRMSDVWSSCVSKATLDESPMAYKGMDHILGSIGDSVAVDAVIKPVYNFKAS